jgi:hypothetical protein
MKIKLMIALVILALAFGMVLISCDDGEMPKIKAGDHEIIADIDLLGTVNVDGYFTSMDDDTTGNDLQDIQDNIQDLLDGIFP